MLNFLVTFSIYQSISTFLPLLSSFQNNRNAISIRPKTTRYTRNRRYLHDYYDDVKSSDTLQYYEVGGIADDIRDLTRHSSEGEVAGIWVSILGLQFPPMDRFAIRPEEKNDLGFSDLAVYHRMQGPGGGPRKHRIVLVVQCKSAEHETRHSMWSTGVGQLGGYIIAKIGQRRGVEQTTVYGAIAIGRYVKFLKYDYDQARVTHWLPGRQAAPYMIGKNCREIQPILDEILQGHHLRYNMEV